VFDSGLEIIPLAGGELRYWAGFLPMNEADNYLEVIQRETPWEQTRIRIAGRVLSIPRLNAWYGDPGAHYGYSGANLPLLPWTETLAGLRHQVIRATGESFNSALVNFYRDGNDSVDWHSDDEAELGKNPAIASLSLGVEREFQLRTRQKPHQHRKIVLNHGSLLVMAGTLQHHWQHRIAKTPAITGARINITFRLVTTPSTGNS
jgi:alkylated DNA repair dioxygenase AlkB